MKGPNDHVILVACVNMMLTASLSPEILLREACGYDTIVLRTTNTECLKEVTMMAKAKANEVEELEELETTDEVEDDEDEEVEVMTPKALATELEISPKTLRGWLRRNFPRGENHGKSWTLTDEQADKAREHFLAEDEDDDSDSEDED